MATDGGGWTLVWKHSYMETSPLSTDMYYFSDYYKSCTTYDSGWCNIPNKKRLNPTEQMIVAYHKGTVVYAYKGIFNYTTLTMTGLVEYLLILRRLLKIARIARIFNQHLLLLEKIIRQ